jgi:broad specificity phosphatase PhoE
VKKRFPKSSRSQRYVNGKMAKQFFDNNGWPQEYPAEKEWTHPWPQRILLVRHGQSEGNTDRFVYARTPDSKVSLTARGFAQGVVAGLQIRNLVGNESVRFFVSPYMRARQTLLAILQAFDGRDVRVSLEPRLREQDFGNFQDPECMPKVMGDRQEFGRFYFRFPDGEAGTDVFDRVASFISYLSRLGRDPSQGPWGEPGGAPAQNFVLVTHGLLMRIFCMCYLRWTVDEFEQVWNPANCEIWVLEYIPGSTYELKGRWRATPYGGQYSSVKYGACKTAALHEHMKTPSASRHVTPGSPTSMVNPELGFLRDLPGPKGRGTEQEEMAGESIVRYWRGDAAGEQMATPPSPAYDECGLEEEGLEAEGLEAEGLEGEGLENEAVAAT